MGPLLVAHPVALGIPEGACIEADHPKPGARQPLQEDPTAGTDAHDDVVHFFPRREAVHLRPDPLHRAQLGC